MWNDELIASDFDYDVLNSTEVEKPHDTYYDDWIIIEEEYKGE